jgi:hypothetical protein
MVKGTAILIDFDRTIYNINPAAKQKMAVRVPDWNIPHIINAAVVRKKMRKFLILFVMPAIINTTAVAAALHPKLAASLNVEKYLIRDPPFKIWVVLPLVSIHMFSAVVKPKLICFQTQNTENNDNIAQKNKYFVRSSGFAI